jgi:hypothetical protein
VVTGELTRASLPFTPRDCIDLWDRLREYLPISAIEDVDPEFALRDSPTVSLESCAKYERVLKDKVTTLAQADATREVARQLLQSFRPEVGDVIVAKILFCRTDRGSGS